MRPFLAILFLSIAILSGCTDDAGPSAKRTIDAIPITAPQLFADYHANEVAADEKYKGKWLAVTGQVDSVGKDILDNIFISLRTQNRFMSARAQMEQSDSDQVARLKRGQKVMLLCSGSGLLLGSPLLDKCRVVEQHGAKK